MGLGGGGGGVKREAPPDVIDLDATMSKVIWAWLDGEKREATSEAHIIIEFLLVLNLQNI